MELTPRLSALYSLLKKSEVDSVLISSPATISYLTGYHGFSPLEREAFLFVTTRNVYLLTSPLHSGATQHIPGITTLIRTPQKPLVGLLDDLVKKAKIKRIGFEETNLTVAEFREFQKITAEFIPINLSSLRMIKDRAEIETIHEASSLAQKALTKSLTYLKPGISEKELVQKIELQMKRLCTDPSFPTIVAFGKNAAIPHHLPNETVLQNNDVVLIDFGARHNGYCSDISRTFFIGTVPKKWKDVYATVEGAQQKAVMYIKRQLESKRTVIAEDVDHIARDSTISKGYLTIPHSLGHGIGIAVHEPPRLSPSSKDVLSDGMVFSIEPGIYLPGEMGVRIEDLFTIQKTELIKLS